MLDWCDGSASQPGPWKRYVLLIISSYLLLIWLCMHTYIYMYNDKWYESYTIITSVIMHAHMHACIYIIYIHIYLYVYLDDMAKLHMSILISIFMYLQLRFCMRACMCYIYKWCMYVIGKAKPLFETLHTVIMLMLTVHRATATILLETRGKYTYLRKDWWYWS